MMSSNPGTNNSTNISLDYAHPVNKDLMIETGVKTVQLQINNTINVDFFNPGSDTYVRDLYNPII